MDSSEIKVFDGKTLSDIFKEIYLNSVDKKEKMEMLIDDLKPFIKTVGDAAMIVPVMKEYMDVSVKNDENLVKMASIVQRLSSAVAKTSTGDGEILTEEEKKQLIQHANQFYNDAMKDSGVVR